MSPWLEKACEKLARERDLILGHMLAYIPVIETEQVPTACLAAADNNLAIFINPEFVKDVSNKSGVDIADAAAVILEHEIWHALLKHFFIKQPDAVMNIAADAIINEYIPNIDKLFNTTTAENMITNPQLNTVPKGTNLITDPTTEELTEELRKLLPPSQNQQSASGQGQSPNDQDESEASGSGSSNDKQPQHHNQSGRIPNNGETLDSHSKLSEVDSRLAEQIEERMRKVVKEALARGLVPGHMVDKIKRIWTPRIRWDRLIRHIAGGTGEAIKQYSYKRFNKRYDIPPGKKTTYSDKLIVFLDTSGSIGQKELEEFFGVVDMLTARFGEVILVQYDVDTTISRYRRGMWKRINVVGRGGTDLDNALKQASKSIKKLYSSQTIVLTDGYDELPEKLPRKTVFVLTKDHNNQFRKQLQERGIPHTAIHVNEN